MKLNTTYNICEDWGWFIDIENSDTLTNYIRVDHFKKNRKRIIMPYNLDKIEEDEYPYKDNMKIQRDIQIIPIEPDIEIFKEYETYNISNICSTTIVTVLLTYFIYFVL